jgi:cellulose synthase/poly-beta-1,6-N-acetylglucosamine synthase-like glycosyltransferase
MILSVVAVAFWTVLGVLLVYTFRHYVFTVNRLFGRNRQPYVNITHGPWPTVTVLIPCHNEETVISGSLDALLESTYPRDRLRIVPIDDRSTDGTWAILDRYASRHPGLIVPLRRVDGIPGKAAALAEATEGDDSEIIVVFDADYVPGPKLVKELVAPFFDPEVGASMGRVVPINVGNTMITRLLDLERAGGYQVDQQARMNLGLVPQYGGTVGGIRRSSLEAVGGWRLDTLAEDTDVTCRLLLDGWNVVYQNRSECYEEVPETWPVRIRQIKRWARGHNQSLVRYATGFLKRPHRMSLVRALDGFLLLNVFALAPLVAFGWLMALVLFSFGHAFPTAILAILAVGLFSALGNLAAFFEVAAAVHLDGGGRRVRLLPFLVFGFLVSLVSVSTATLTQLFSRSEPQWEKTERFRRPEALASPEPVRNETQDSVESWARSVSR